MIDFNRFRVLTFDCYGTMIDWETGIFSVLRPLLRAHQKTLADATILELYSELEPLAQRSFLPYRQGIAIGRGRIWEPPGLQPN